MLRQLKHAAIPRMLMRAPLIARLPQTVYNRFSSELSSKQGVFLTQMRANSMLVSLLEREIEEEKGNCFEGEELESLQAQIEKVFTITEKPNHMEVVLNAHVRGHDVRVKFDAQDVVDLDEEEYEDEEEAEFESAPKDGEEEEEDTLPGIRFTAEISKNGSGLQFECVASSNVTVERIRFLENVDTDATNEDLYFGPNFVDLEYDLQGELYNYLADYRVDDVLAQFIAQYADLKEQREYLAFLQQSTKFLKQ